MTRKPSATLVRALRADLGEDVKTFGERWRKSGRTVENWEQGRRVPDAFVLEQLRKLAAQLQRRARS